MGARGPIGPDPPGRCKDSTEPFHAGAFLGMLRLLRSKLAARVLLPSPQQPQIVSSSHALSLPNVSKTWCIIPSPDNSIVRAAHWWEKGTLYGSWALCWAGCAGNGITSVDSETKCPERRNCGACLGVSMASASRSLTEAMSSLFSALSSSRSGVFRNWPTSVSGSQHSCEPTVPNRHEPHTTLPCRSGAQGDLPMDSGSQGEQHPLMILDWPCLQSIDKACQKECL